MQHGKTSSVEQLQLVSQFDSLRKILRSQPYAGHLEKPLAFWALPGDRRLPLALLGRPLGDLLGRSFHELAATPGIGQKKIASLVMLLARAANTDPADLPGELPENPETLRSAKSNGAAPDGFDPTGVSEVVWAQWRATVVKHRLGGETLGRLAPSLRHMTRVIWNSPLDAYTRKTLAEIRAMKTHGQKRVAAILEVFHAVHVVASGMGAQPSLLVRIVPRLIDGVEQWVAMMLQTPGVPPRQAVFEHFVGPLVEQLRVDATEPIVRLAENRLGIAGPITSVRQAARSMGLTRARVYQLLNDIHDILMVRWPNGRYLTHLLRAKFESESALGPDDPELAQFLAAGDLFFPDARPAGSAEPERYYDELDDAQVPELLEV
jgi:hypothetical protein